MIQCSGQVEDEKDGRHEMFTKVFCMLLAGVFAVAAVVQLNDPDPVVWFLLYGLVAAVFAMAAWQRFSVAFIWGVGLACAAGFVLLAPSTVELLTQHGPSQLAGPMSPNQPYIEEARESLGMLLCVAALVYAHWLARKASRRSGD